MSNKNMKLWEQVCETDPKHTKYVNQRGGFTAIDAQKQVKRATEMFGPIGVGWGVKNEVFTPMANGMALYQSEFWYKSKDGDGSFPINSSIAMQKNGRIDDDFAKKVTTDALTKGLSKLGFNSDIFEGKFDDNKYVKEMDTKFNTSYITESQLKEIRGLIESVHMTEKEYRASLDWIKKPTITSEQAELFINSLKSKEMAKNSSGTKYDKLVEDAGGKNEQS